MISHPLRGLLAAIPLLGFVTPSCQPGGAPSDKLPPAYTSNQITDPALRKLAEEIQTWASQQTDADRKPRYSRVEVLAPVPIVQPYGVGVFQQELRLPVVLTTGPAWGLMKTTEKEAAVAKAFLHVSELLGALKQKQAIQPTLTVQTPEGMVLAWINHLDPKGKNVHGDD